MQGSSKRGAWPVRKAPSRSRREAALRFSPRGSSRKGGATSCRTGCWAASAGERSLAFKGGRNRPGNGPGGGRATGEKVGRASERASERLGILGLPLGFVGCAAVPPPPPRVLCRFFLPSFLGRLLLLLLLAPHVHLRGLAALLDSSAKRRAAWRCLVLCNHLPGQRGATRRVGLEGQGASLETVSLGREQQHGACSRCPGRHGRFSPRLLLQVPVGWR